MDRRMFLTGMLGVAGAAALAGVVRPPTALAGVPNARGGILDELDSPDVETEGAEIQPELEPIQYRRRDRRHRRRRRRVWRRICRRYWRHGRRRVRCYRRRVWV